MDLEFIGWRGFMREKLFLVWLWFVLLDGDSFMVFYVLRCKICGLFLRFFEYVC